MLSAAACRERLEAFRDHQDAEAFAALVSEFRPLVERICRRYMIVPADLDDAVQETFLKLARKAQAIEGDVAAWLRATAGTTALDFARRALRQRAQIKTLAKMPGDRTAGLPWHVLQPRLDEALADLEPEARTLVMSRFFDEIAVARIARSAGVCSSVMQRRVTRAVGKVRRTLHKMGYQSLEDALLGASEGRITAGENKKQPGTARPPPSGVMWIPPSRPHDDPPPGLRPLRVGIFVSHTALTVPNDIGWIAPLDRQLSYATHLQAHRYRLISLVEPDTQEYPMIERAAREFCLTAGMLDAADPEALKLLDVILLGEVQATSGRVLSAVAEAVESGVGLFNSGFVGVWTPGFEDPRTKRLFLTEQLGVCHTPVHHGLPRPATIHRHHPLLAPLGPGTQMQVHGCGPIFVPDPSCTQILMTQDRPADNVSPHIPELLGQRIPVVTVGTLGRGRVAIVATMTPEPLATHLAYGGRFLMNAIDYLAEPRAAERAAWAF